MANTPFTVRKSLLHHGSIYSLDFCHSFVLRIYHNWAGNTIWHFLSKNKPEENKGKRYNQRKIENWVSLFLQYYRVMFHCLINNVSYFNNKVYLILLHHQLFTANLVKIDMILEFKQWKLQPLHDEMQVRKYITSRLIGEESNGRSHLSKSRLYLPTNVYVLVIHSSLSLT